MKSLLLRLSKLLLKLAMDEALRRGLPAIYQRLDAELPLLLSNQAPPSRVKGLVASAVSDAVGHRAGMAEIETVITLYDPIRAAAAMLTHRYAMPSKWDNPGGPPRTR